MDPLEEQAQEIEVLESIYPDELEKISETEFILHIKLETTPTQYIDLHIEYPPEYPEVVPLIEVDVGEKWVNPDHDEYDEDDEDEDEEEEELPGVAPALLELNQKDCLSLDKILEASAEENIGMASVFTLASTLKEEAEAIVQGKFDAAEQERVKELLRQEAEEQKKFIGTPVTVESFNEWRRKFRDEFKLDEKDHVHTVYDSKGQPKLTGREMFERGISKVDEDEELEAGVGNLKV
ncbi:similar to Saccharomyces cerevisiae YDR152W GIR2 Highly-acidic cytoplasmic RWD domain-containing protein of unknown function [Geotrichum candidum]|uniref:RWD domain-containing protein n=1 Tax=Geotrichum candidum TaxID=1173061 RepID=A0A0J9XGT9_GEOCN|nr:similar to Saccharomyces cerevisiae YDR152W GIR2 Highly-acidic cytoplasmic RWD domain-containing protein of unknown function [Geotrichum candidum]